MFKKVIKALIICILLCCAGVSSVEDQNVALNKTMYEASKYSIVTQLTDGKKTTGIKVDLLNNKNVFVLDIGESKYLRLVNLYFQADEVVDAEPIEIEYSSDILSWEKINPAKISLKKSEANIDAFNITTQFLKVKILSKHVKILNEIEVFPETDYNLQILESKVDEVKPDSVVVFCRTNKLTRAQVVYEDEENYLYLSRLSLVSLDIEASSVHSILVKDLAAKTKYRYQLILSDLNGKQIKTEIMAFVTQ